MSESTPCSKCGETWSEAPAPYRVNGTVRQLHAECAQNLSRDHTVEAVEATTTTEQRGSETHESHAEQAIWAARVFSQAADAAEDKAREHEDRGEWAAAARSWSVAVSNWAAAAAVVGPLPTAHREAFTEEAAFCRTERAACESHLI